MKPFFVSIPHSGEEVPPKATWLKGLAEPVLMRDVDRFVDQLYFPILTELELPVVKARWHRYVVDLNRVPEDVDCDSVLESKNPSGRFTTGLHWVKTTKGEVLMPKPISTELHNQFVSDYYQPFHTEVKAMFERFQKQGFKNVYQIDAHSMPSMGTKAHRDPGQRRADVVVSDFEGKSSEPRFKDLVIKAFSEAGLKVSYNWPYIGGRVTQIYGQPSNGQHTIQVELNRDLYMNEETKQLKVESANSLKAKISIAVRSIYQNLSGSS